MSGSRRGTAQWWAQVREPPERQALRWSKAEYENEGKGERKQQCVGTANSSLTEA